MDGPELRIVLIHRRTRLADLIARHNTLDQARFYVERLGGDFADYVREDARYRAVLTQAEQALRARGRVQPLERGFLPNYLFGRDDLVVVVGQDGLVANTLKYLDGQAVIAVNPDPSRFAGVLLPFAVEDLPAIVPEARAGTRPIRDLAMAEARLSDGQRLLAVNDLFLGPRRHTTAAYVLQHGERSEAQWSSGLIVSTGLGATGWLGSILAGAAALWRGSGSNPGPAAPDRGPDLGQPPPPVRRARALCRHRRAHRTGLRAGRCPHAPGAGVAHGRGGASSSAMACSTMRCPSTPGPGPRCGWPMG